MGGLALSSTIEFSFKGIVSRKLTLCCCTLLESSLFKGCPAPLKIIFIKGPVRKLHMKISVFTAHLPLKVQGSFKVLSSACSAL